MTVKDPKQTVAPKQVLYKSADMVLPARGAEPTFDYLIEKKRDGGEFSEEEIRQIVDGILDEELPERQLSALIMSIFYQGMSAQETATFSEELMLSGEVIYLSDLSTPKIEKYSTGGVGDKTSLILPALSAACGVTSPTMVGRDETFVVSNLDKLSAIPGFKAEMSMADFVSQLKKVGCAICRVDDEIAPVESTLFELREQTATIPSIPLMVSTILSNKLAQGAEGLVVDVKWGSGAFVKDVEQAKQLARSITRVGRSMKRRCVALVTDMNQPLGASVGTSVELLEAVQLLKGEGPEDLQELLLKLGMEVVRLAGVAGSTLSAKQTVEKRIADGSALETFKAMIEAQGGKTDWVDNPDKMKKARYSRKLPAPKRGYVHTINAALIASGVKILATDKKGKLDPAVGVTELQKVGAQVKQGEPLMMIHYNDETQLEEAVEYFKVAYRLAPKRPTTGDLVVERVA